jgi:hypothetical protein
MKHDMPAYATIDTGSIDGPLLASILSAIAPLRFQPLSLQFIPLPHHHGITIHRSAPLLFNA